MINITISDFVEKMVGLCAEDWISITKEELESSDGRKVNPNPSCTEGAFIYVALQDDLVLYVGETSKSVKRRFTGDGSGSHKKKNSEWYERMTTVKFIKKTSKELPDMQRKLLEQVFSIHFKPEFYGKISISSDC